MKIPVRMKRMGGKGQSTIEFMLMVPIIFAIFFFIIEMSLYFSAIHYSNYAAFALARCKEVGYGRFTAGGGYKLAPDKIAQLVLTGSVFQGNYGLSNESSSSTGALTIGMQSWKTNFPFVSSLMPDMPFTVSVNLGPDEIVYEKRDPPPCTDNDIQSNPC